MGSQQELVSQRVKRAELKAKGICVDCRDPNRSLGDHVVCARCRRQRLEREERRQLRIAQQEFAERMSA